MMTENALQSEDSSQRQTLAAALARSVASELDDVSQAGSEDFAGRLEHATTLLNAVCDLLTYDATAVSAAKLDLQQQVDGGADPVTLRDSIKRLASVQHSRVESGAETEAPTPTEAPKPLSCEQVTEYLQARNPGSTDHAVDVRVLAGGFSKVTTLVAAVIEGRQIEIVLRQAPLGRSARSLVPEFEVVKFLHSNGFPSPRPLWIEPGENSLGGGFFATERAMGTNTGDVWGPAGASPEICLEIASIYARLHTLPTADLITPISPRSNSDELAAMITYQRETLHKRRIEIQPTLAAVLSWLEKNIPPDPSRKSLIHGDAAFSNLLVNDSHVSAVLDWESAHVGNAAEELAYLKPSIEPIVPWTDFLSAYQAAGGEEPVDDAMKFFEVWSHTWRHIGCLWLAQNYDQTKRYSSAVAAYVHGPRFLDRAVESAFGAA